MGNKNGTPVLREQDIAALSKSSGMDAAQVKEHFNAFLTAHPNGKMKPKEFREMVEKTMPKSDASKMEKHVFRIYDSNNDGYIDFVEFMLIFHISRLEDGELAKDMLEEQGANNWPGLAKEVNELIKMLRIDHPRLTQSSRRAYKEEVSRACRWKDEAMMKEEMGRMKEKMRTMYFQNLQMKE